MALISLNNLERFFNNLKTYISNALNSKANTSHTHTTADISNLAENWNVTGTNLDISFAGSSNNNGQLSIQINGTDITTFMANQITNSTFNLNFNSFGYNLIPSANETYNLGSATNNYNTVYSKKVVSTGNSLNLYASALDQGAVLCLDKNNTQFDGAFRIYTGTSSYILKGLRTGTLSWSGTSIVPANDNACDLGSSTYNFKNVYAYKLILKNSYIARTVNNDYLGLCGGTDYSNGAYFTLYGKDSTINVGAFRLRANDGTNSKELIGKPDGTLSWSGRRISSNSSSDELNIDGGAEYTLGATLWLTGKNNAKNSGVFGLVAHNGTVEKMLRGNPNGTLTWNGQSIQTTSDARLKQQISEIDDDLLTAWKDVSLVQFKYNDAVEQKSDNARLHTGYVVQQINEACKSHNVDISQYGLYCHEVYQEETREVENADGTKKTEVIRPASEHYSLRYTEALVVECAYLRKQIELLQERLNKLEEK